MVANRTGAHDAWEAVTSNLRFATAHLGPRPTRCMLGMPGENMASAIRSHGGQVGMEPPKRGAPWTRQRATCTDFLFFLSYPNPEATST
jgi:hypothetical protein